MMRSKIKAIINKFKTVDTFQLSVFMGLLMFLWLVWVRFLRTRIPRDIPFDLTLYGLFLLLSICFTILFVIKTRIRPSQSLVLAEILAPLNMSLSNFSSLVRSNSYHELFIFYSVKILHPFMQTDFYSRIKYESHFILGIAPRILLLFIFYVDVLYFKRIELSYSFILLGLISPLAFYWYSSLTLFIPRYVFWLDQFYRVKFISNDPHPEANTAPLITRDEDDDDEEDGEDHSGCGESDNRYVGIRTQKFLDNLFMYHKDKDIIYKPIPRWEKLVLQMYPDAKPQDEFTEEQNHHLNKIFHKNMPVLVDAYFLLEKYKFHIEFCEKEIKYTNVMICLAYFLLWLYILIVSLPNFHITNMEWVFLERFQDTSNPFINSKMEKPT